MTKEARIYNGEKEVSSISCAGKTGQLHVQERNENSLIACTKINARWTKDLHVRLDTIKQIAAISFWILE